METKRAQVLIKFGLVLLFMPVAHARAGEQFKLLNSITLEPEYHHAVTNFVLVTERKKVTFRPPADWALTSDPGTRTISLRSPNDRAALSFTLIPDDPSLNAALATATRPNDPKPEELRQRALDLFPGALILGEFPCFANGLQGRTFDLAFNGAGRTQALVRLAFVRYSDGVIQFRLATTAKFSDYHGAFTALINSIQIENLPPKKT